MMTGQNKEFWSAIITLSIGIIFIGAAVWMPLPPPLPELQAHADSQRDQRLVKLEQAVTALTQALQVNQTQDARPEPIRVTAPASTEVSRQDLAQIIREEARHVVADASPENQRAREEAIAEAQVLNSPENHVAYQSASSVVTTAVAAKRWTEEDKETLRAAVGLLTNDQRMELMNILAPAINRGENHRGGDRAVVLNPFNDRQNDTSSQNQSMYHLATKQSHFRAEVASQVCTAPSDCVRNDRNLLVCRQA